MFYAYAYLRISTEDQSNFSLEAQEEIIRKYAASHNFQIEKVYTDDGVSAKNFNRPAWKQLELDLSKSKGTIRAVVVAKYDRLIRNAAEGLALLERFEMKLQVQIISAGENFYIDPHSPFYFKIRADMFVNAEFERRVIADRTKMGVWQARSQGRWVAPAPLGYKNEKGLDGKPMLVIDPVLAPVIKKLFEDVANGIPVADALRIARKNGYRHTGKGAAYRTLSKLIYAGFIEVPAYGREPAKVVKGKQEAIISKEVFDKVQHIITGKPQVHIQQREEFPLRGILLCQQCSLPLTAGFSTGKMKKKFPYYRCRKCNGENYNADKVHMLVTDILHQLSLPGEQIQNIRGESERLMEQRLATRYQIADRLKIEIRDLETKIHQLEEKYITDKIEESTYRRYIGVWKRDLRGKKIEYEQATADERGYWELFYKNLNLLSDIAGLFSKSKLENKQRIMKLVFAQPLHISLQGLRTPQINPILHRSKLIINNLEVLAWQKNGDISANVSLGSAGEA